MLGLTFRTLIIVSFLIFLPQAQAASPDAGAPGAKPSIVSANGFTCTQMGSGVTCKGSFKDLDKKLTLSASGQQQVNIAAEKNKNSYSYSSSTGCLCMNSKSSVKCTNQSGKSKTFKGDKKVQESTAFCKEGK